MKSKSLISYLREGTSLGVCCAEGFLSLLMCAKGGNYNYAIRDYRKEFLLSEHRTYSLFRSGHYRHMRI